jgi:hypothetical protein
MARPERLTRHILVPRASPALRASKSAVLPICRTPRECSSSEHTIIKKYHLTVAFFYNGAPGEIRTPDLLVRSQLLYPAELRAPVLRRELCHDERVLSMKKPVFLESLREFFVINQQQKTETIKIAQHQIRQSMIAVRNLF